MPNFQYTKLFELADPIVIIYMQKANALSLQRTIKSQREIWYILQKNINSSWVGYQQLDCFLGIFRNGYLHKPVSEQVPTLTYFSTNPQMCSSSSNLVVITYTSMAQLIQIPLFPSDKDAQFFYQSASLIMAVSQERTELRKA